jgi:hypothetical protein
VTYTATAKDDYGVTSVKIFVDDKIISECHYPEKSLNVICEGKEGPYSGGSSHTYYAQAFDDAAHSKTSEKRKFTVFYESRGCSGKPSLSLSPNPAAPKAKITATISGLSKCDGKKARVYLYDGYYHKFFKCSCSVSGSGCSCDFEAPPSPGNFLYLSGVDVNNDGTDDVYGSTVILSIVSPTTTTTPVTQEPQGCCEFPGLAGTPYCEMKTKSECERGSGRWYGPDYECEYGYCKSKITTTTTTQPLPDCPICAKPDQVCKCGNTYPDYMGGRIYCSKRGTLHSSIQDCEYNSNYITLKLNPSKSTYALNEKITINVEGYAYNQVKNVVVYETKGNVMMYGLCVYMVEGGNPIKCSVEKTFIEEGTYCFYAKAEVPYYDRTIESNRVCIEVKGTQITTTTTTQPAATTTTTQPTECNYCYIRNLNCPNSVKTGEKFKISFEFYGTGPIPKYEHRSLWQDGTRIACKYTDETACTWHSDFIEITAPSTQGTYTYTVKCFGAASSSESNCNLQDDSKSCTITVTAQTAATSTTTTQPTTASCDNNPDGCQTELDCSDGKKCDCWWECSGSYCWGDSANSYTCHSRCAPCGKYAYQSTECCSNTFYDSNSKMCYCCDSNPPGCQSSLDCDAGKKCDCNEECASGYSCVDGVCKSQPAATTTTTKPSCPYSCLDSTICHNLGGSCKSGYYCEPDSPCCCYTGASPAGILGNLWDFIKSLLGIQ